jgi:hypothetical protein
LSSNQQNQNDIEQILNEVEELRKELSSEAESVDIESVAKEMASVLSEGGAPAVTSTTTPSVTDLPAANASAPMPSPTFEVISAPVPTLAQATEVAKELAALAEATLTDATLTDATLAGATLPETMPAMDMAFPNDTPAETPAVPVVASPEETPVASLDAEESIDAEESMESTLSEFKDDPSVKTLLDETFDDQARRQVEKEVPSMNQSDNNESSPSLTLSLTGSMTLKLKYEFAGQEVTVGFTDEYLKVELADGTEFKIPVGRQKTLRRVA